ncbi:hypothetical protein D3C76_1629180 [compost metagenome]
MRNAGVDFDDNAPFSGAEVDGKADRINGHPVPEYFELLLLVERSRADIQRLDRLMRQHGSFIDPVGSHGVVGIGNPDPLRIFVNFRSFKTSRIARAVNPFMML